MYYGYDLCRSCKNNFIEREQAKNNRNEFGKFGGDCPICGEKMVLTCVSEGKLKSTYQILLSERTYKECLQNASILEYMNQNREMLQKEKMDSEQIVFEGNPIQIYNFMDILDKNQMSYSELPEFPIRFDYYDICSTCGGPLVSKEVEVDDPEDYVLTGEYCESCKKWELFTCVSKVSLDETVYKLILDKDCVWDRELLKVMQYLIGKEEIQNKKDAILMEKTAVAIQLCGERLKAANIPFHIEPEFPHEILPYEEITEEFLMEILKRQSWYKEEEELGYKGEESKNTFKAT